MARNQESAMRLRPVFLFLALGLVARAQVVPNQPGQWVPKGFLVTEGMLPCRGAVLDAADRVQLRLPLPPKQEGERGGMPFPPFWADGAFQVIAGSFGTGPEGQELLHTRLYRYEQNAWKVAGRLDCHAAKGLVKLIPCRDGRAIALTSREDLRGAKAPGERSPFCRLTLGEDGAYRVEGSLDPGMEQVCKDAFFFRIPSVSPILFGKDCATVLHRHSGLFWVFSLETGGLLRSGRLFDAVTDELIRQERTKDLVEALHPLPDGRILLLVHPLDDVLERQETPEQQAKRLLKDNQTLGAAEIAAFYKDRQRIQAERAPAYHWFAFDPEKGGLERLVPPPAGVLEFYDRDRGSCWRPLPDGTVRWGRVVPKDADATPR